MFFGIQWLGIPLSISALASSPTASFLTPSTPESLANLCTKIAPLSVALIIR